MPKNIVDIMSTPPPPFSTKVTKEQAPEQHSISPLDLCKNAMSKAVKGKFNKDRNLQPFIEKLPEIFTSVQKISTKSPLFEVGGYQPGHEFQSRTFATITSTFERNPNKEDEVTARRTATITPTVPQTNLPAVVPTGGEEHTKDIN